MLRSTSWVYVFCDADIRLVGSRLPHEGRLEIKVGGVWGTVCDDYFDTRDARVACYMLGYGYVYKHISLMWFYLNFVALSKGNTTILTSAGLLQHKGNIKDNAVKNCRSRNRLSIHSASARQIILNSCHSSKKVGIQCSKTACDSKNIG